MLIRISAIVGMMKFVCLFYRNFWEVLHSLTLVDKRRFLLFCTGSDRVPIRGLSAMRLIVSQAGGGPERLMSSHTCFNHLLLPPYGTIELMRQRVMQALENSEGTYIYLYISFASLFYTYIIYNNISVSHYEHITCFMQALD